MASIRYRADIDGLRAVAVCTVLLFHAGLGLLPGGFIGVDVFFVISGYLITSIILAELERGQFSILGFYERRIRRISPALTVVIAASIAIGWFVLTPYDYMHFGRSVIATAAFYSNFYFDSQSGYFAPASETQPLLHTWSLGVEEQFYLLVPGFLLLLALPRIRHFRTPAFLGIMALSFAMSVYGVEEDRSSAFYLLPSRAFELMIGMALALGLVPPIRTRGLRQVAGVGGLAMILMAACFYSAETPFPGFAALLPCLGAALLIHSGYTEDTATYRLLAIKPMVFVGKVSYSLYLWHWPLLAYAAYEFGESLQPYHRLGLLGLAFGLSVVTYFWVEQPARRGRVFPTRLSVYAAGTASLLCCLTFTGITDVTRGLPQRLSQEAAEFVRGLPGKYATRSECLPNSPDGTCLIGNGDASARPSFALWGDSHARVLSKALANQAHALDLAGYAVVASGCPPVLVPSRLKDRWSKKCARSARQLLHIIDSDPHVQNIILASRWGVHSRKLPDEFRQAVLQTVDRVRGPGRTVTIIGPVPELPFHLPKSMTKALMKGETRDFSVPFADFEEQQAATLKTLAELDRLPRVRVLYPHLILCDAERCRTVGDGQPLYVDGDHLSPRGAAALAGLLKEALASPQAIRQEVVGRIEYPVH